MARQAEGAQDQSRRLTTEPAIGSTASQDAEPSSRCQSDRPMKVVALLTCHNRKDLTLRSLDGFVSQRFSTAAPPELQAVVVDDGSTDGTREAVQGRFSSVHVIRADGTLYWARGMQLAESHAIVDRPDFLLWLNDDVRLDAAALDALLATAAEHTDAVVVGALRDPETGVVTYSGVVQSRWHPMRTRLVEPTDSPLEADTFNGNLVLVPRAVFERVGPIDGAFSHGQADFDYGLRARRSGFRVLVAPGSLGTCARGSHHGTFYDTTLTLRRRWQLAQSAVGLPMRSHARFLRRHGGRLWPLFWAAPYVKLTLSALATAPRRRLSRARLRE
jgi:GT2 family glycosyltransferase